MAGQVWIAPLAVNIRISLAVRYGNIELAYRPFSAIRTPQILFFLIFWSNHNTSKATFLYSAENLTCEKFIVCCLTQRRRCAVVWILQALQCLAISWFLLTNFVWIRLLGLLTYVNRQTDTHIRIIDDSNLQMLDWSSISDRPKCFPLHFRNHTGCKAYVVLGLWLPASVSSRVECLRHEDESSCTSRTVGRIAWSFILRVLCLEKLFISS